MAQDLKKRIKQLRDQIRRHDHLYYVLNAISQLTVNYTTGYP